jgi:hypothetical protein
MMCRSTLEHRGQPNVRKSWPNELGSIAVNFIGEPQVVHCGPWFCTSSIGLPLTIGGSATELSVTDNCRCGAVI